MSATLDDVVKELVIIKKILKLLINKMGGIKQEDIDDIKKQKAIT